MKKIVSIIFLFIVCTQPSLARDYGENAGWTDFTNADRTYRVRYPYKWPPEEKGATVTFRIPDNTHEYPQVGLIEITEEPFRQNWSFDEYKTWYIGDMKADPRFRVIEASEVKLVHGGRRAVFIKLKYPAPQEPDLVFDKYGYSFIANNRVYNMVYTVVPDLDDPYNYVLGSVKTMLEGIEILK